MKRKTLRSRRDGSLQKSCYHGIWKIEGKRLASNSLEKEKNI